MNYETAEEVALDKLLEVLVRESPILQRVYQTSKSEGKTGKENMAYRAVEMLSMLSVGFITPTTDMGWYYTTQLGDYRGHAFDFSLPNEDDMPTREIYETRLQEAKSKPDHVLADGVEDNRFGWYLERASYAELQRAAARAPEAIVGAAKLEIPRWFPKDATSAPDVIADAPEETQKISWYKKLFGR